MISLLTIVRINNAKIKSPKLITIERVCWFLLVFHPAFTLATAHSNNWFHSWLEWICLGQGLCATRASLAGSIWLVDEEEVDRPIFSLTDWRREREREKSSLSNSRDAPLDHFERFHLHLYMCSPAKRLSVFLSAFMLGVSLQTCSRN
jgi:hypothetical protein